MSDCRTHDDMPYPAGHPFDGMEFLIDSETCPGCDCVMPWNAIDMQRGVCFDCRDEQDGEEWERNRGPQTLADVGMCEADFR